MSGARWTTKQEAGSEAAATSVSDRKAARGNWVADRILCVWRATIDTVLVTHRAATNRMKLRATASITMANLSNLTHRNGHDRAAQSDSPEGSSDIRLSVLGSHGIIYLGSVC